MKGLAARLRALMGGKKRSPAQKRPPIENPYRRFYTADRSFEELVRRARETRPGKKGS